MGEEPWPDVPGTDKDDGWLNVKLDRVSHPDPDPNQRGELGGGPDITMPCWRCNSTMHIGAVRTAKEMLEGGGYKLNDGIKNLDGKVAICVCLNGHVTQLRYDAAQKMIKRD